jgi:hypothetical protein
LRTTLKLRPVEGELRKLCVMMVSPSTTVVASSPEVRAATVGFVPAISFIEESSVWETTPCPAVPSNVHTTETETGLGKNPSSSRKVIWPMGIGNQVTERSWDVSMLVAPFVVATGEVMTARPGMDAETSKAGTPSSPPPRNLMVPPVPSAIGEGKPTVGYPNPPYTSGTVVVPIEAEIGPKFPYPCAGLPIPPSWQEVS